MAKLNHIRRYRFDDETNIALQKLGKKEAQEVRQCIRVMLENKGLLKPLNYSKFEIIDFKEAQVSEGKK